MITLVLSQKKILPFKKAAEWFGVFNKGGIISLVLLLIIIISLASYLAALFLTFNLGFKIQIAEKEFAQLKDTVAALELQIQKEETSFVKDHKDILESMERVSSIKYLAIDNFAISSPQIGY